jgi:hypothetical protein
MVKLVKLLKIEKPTLHLRMPPVKATNTSKQSKATNSSKQSKATNSSKQSKATNSLRQTKATNASKQSKATNSSKQSKATNLFQKTKANNSAKTGNGKHKEDIYYVKELRGHKPSSSKNGWWLIETRWQDYPLSKQHGNR